MNNVLLDASTIAQSNGVVKSVTLPDCNSAVAAANNGHLPINDRQDLTKPQVYDKYRMRDMALAYAAKGLHVFPLHEPIFDENNKCIGCTCEEYLRSDKAKEKGHPKADPTYKCPDNDRGKHPRIAKWEKLATTDPEQIKKWWSKGDLLSNIGCAVGPSGLLMIDMDSYKDHYKGADFLTDEELDTVTTISGSGGTHLYYKISGAKFGNARWNFPEGVDIRCWGGQAVLPGSRHHSGTYYQAENDNSFFDREPAELSDRLFQLLTEGNAKSGAAVTVTFSDESLPKPDLAKWRISQKIIALIVEGHAQSGPDGTRDEDDMSVITALVEQKATDDDILAVYQNYLIGTGPKSKFAEKGLDHLRPMVEKVRQRAGGGAIVTSPPATLDASGLPEIDIHNRQLRYIVEDALSAIIKSIDKSPDHPILYVRNGGLVRIARTEKGFFAPCDLTDKGLQPILSNVANWVKIEITEKGIRESNKFPPSSVISSLANLGEWDGIPALERVVTAPVFAPDGTLHSKPGYNKHSCLYYAGGVVLGDVTPTLDRVAWAKSLIVDDLLHDFPFVDAASKAHAVALLLLPFIRPMIDGPTPLHLIDAPTPGSGKGLLAEMCSFPHLGTIMSSTPTPPEEAEWRKVLTTKISEGASHVLFDNINETLNSGSFAAALTQRTWSDRLLQVSKSITATIETVWVATGNNLDVRDEMTRRCLWIRLDANVEKPWERNEFKHENLKLWVAENRNDLATAAITLVNSWFQAGKPQYTKRIKGTYPQWGCIMGGILENAGIPGFLDNEAELFDRVTSTATMMKDFVEAWAEKYKEERTVTGDLFKLASYADDDFQNRSGDWKNLLGDLLTSNTQRGRQSKLGRLLHSYADRVIGGYKIIYSGAAKGHTYYALRDTKPKQRVIEL